LTGALPFERGLVLKEIGDVMDAYVEQRAQALDRS